MLEIAKTWPNKFCNGITDIYIYICWYSLSTEYYSTMTTNEIQVQLKALMNFTDIIFYLKRKIQLLCHFLVTQKQAQASDISKMVD